MFTSALSVSVDKDFSPLFVLVCSGAVFTTAPAACWSKIYVSSFSLCNVRTSFVSLAQLNVGTVVVSNKAYKQTILSQHSDEMTVEFETSRSCDFAVGREKYIPMKYGVGMQNNSIYENMMTD